MHNSGSINRGGLISSTSVHQFYQSQRPVNYYHNPVQGPRVPTQNYQNKRRYNSGKCWIGINNNFLFFKFRNRNYSKRFRVFLVWKRWKAYTFLKIFQGEIVRLSRGCRRTEVNVLK